MDSPNERWIAEPLGREKYTVFDRFGNWLSLRGVLKLLPRQRSNLTLLDLGCGYKANLLRSLSPYLSRGVGIDVKVSPGCKRLPKLEFHEGDLQDYISKFPAASFDVITMINVLEHISAPLSILQKAKDLLTDRGRLIINVPTWRGKWALETVNFRLKMGSESVYRSIDEHVMYYDLPDLWPVLAKAGFKGSHIRLRRHKFGLNLIGYAQNDRA
jgi:SAM-dependent methyltransferase